MKAVRRFCHRLLGSMAGGCRDDDLSQEIDSHLQMLTEDLIRRGARPEEAARQARLAFGGIEATKERWRDQRGLPAVDSLRQDVGVALRSWRRAPGFAAVALLSLGVGLGISAMAFMLLNGLLLKPLPVRDPGRLRIVKWVGADPPVDLSGRIEGTASGETEADAFSADAYRRFRDHAADLTDVVALSSLPPLAVIGPGATFSATALLVSGNFFGGLGVPVHLGRPLGPGDDHPGAEPAAVVSYRCWRDELGSDRGAVGRPLTINGHLLTLVGVLAPSFRGVLGRSATDLYVPLSAQPRLRPRTPWDSPTTWTLQIMARLRPGGDERRAAAVAAALFDSTVPSTRETAGGPRRPYRILLADGSLGFQYSVRRSLTALWVLAGSAALVLLVACANLTGLQIVRGRARQHELAVRTALGAGRGRLIRLALTESVLLAGGGGALGLLLAVWSTSVVPRMIWPTDTALDFGLDRRVFLVVLVLSAATALLTGLLPAIRSTPVSLPTRVAGHRPWTTPRLRAGRLLVVVQAALSLLLLVGAGLFTRTVLNLHRVQTGFDPARVLIFSLDASSVGHDRQGAIGIYERVLAEIRRVPGVLGTAHSDMVMLSGWRGSTVARVPDRSADRRPIPILALTVSHDFFSTMGLPVRRGRTFVDGDSARAPRVVVVNEAMARAAFGRDDPLGRFVEVFGRRAEVVGIVRDMTYVSLRDRPEPVVFFPVQQKLMPGAQVHVEVRTAGDPLALVPTIRSIVAGIDRRLPIAEVTTQAAQLDASIVRERGLMRLAVALATIAVLLSCVGLYGVMAYQVARGTREIGLRMAIGSTPARVVRPLVGQACGTVAAGIGIGLLGVAAGGELVRTELFGVEPYDPVVITASVVVLVVAAIAGVAVPARRAARVDPTTALRCE